MDLLGKLFWVALYLVLTFAFVVLFEFGPDNYAANARRSFDALVVQIKNPGSVKPDR